MFTGFTRGLQLIADFIKLFVKAVEKSNVEAVTEALAVARTWLGETVNEAGAVKISGWTLAFTNSDPWKGSRAAYQALALKWNGKL